MLPPLFIVFFILSFRTRFVYGEDELFKIRAQCSNQIIYQLHQVRVLFMAIIFRNDSRFHFSIWRGTDLILIDMNINRYIIYNYIKSGELFILTIDSS